MAFSSIRPELDTLDTVGAHLERCGVDRRDFLGFCAKLMVAAPAGLAIAERLTPEAVAAEVAKAQRLPVVWLHFQDCTGCSETLLRTSKPDLVDLIFHLISLDYHETLMVASGHDAEAALHTSMKKNAGKYIAVVEGSIPQKGDGQAGYMKVAGHPAHDILEEVAANAAAVVAIGSCATWGGIPSAPPNPTSAVGVSHFIKDKPVINLPGCPPNPYVLLGVVLQYARTGTLPELDEKGRPKFAYDRVIHDHCPRRAHFDAGRFAEDFGDEGHKQGWCLYKLGCKGPDTHAPCSTMHFNEVVGAWPIGIGAPCFGCTEEHIAFKVPLFDKIPIHDAKPPDTYPPVLTAKGEVDPIATGLVGVGVGAIAGAGFVAARRFTNREAELDVDPSEPLTKRDQGDQGDRS